MSFPPLFLSVMKKVLYTLKGPFYKRASTQGPCPANTEEVMITDNLTEEERVQCRIEFYREVSKGLAERLKAYPLQEDVYTSHPDDYDGGRFDYLTSRGVK